MTNDFEGSVSTRCSVAHVGLRKTHKPKWYRVFINGKCAEGITARRIPGEGWSWYEGLDRRGKGLSQSAVKDDIRWKLTGQ